MAAQVYCKIKKGFKEISCLQEVKKGLQSYSSNCPICAQSPSGEEQNTHNRLKGARINYSNNFI